ncbi:phosphoenolpyruvate synthase [Kineobactrum sediminis]|uniref:Phosphoenolpyruvate synthase n=1 Tax=Kineobactrum sediminis TaxID=1905677 RepID=A0A2N5Y0W3_9GAMM|nr:phosphoenolpyruvate synthase [Kineobactrum sediminis]PLW82030.1 phosphoenolpyruvate synthase [Kineobactrum sediminis]
MTADTAIKWFDELGLENIEAVGGKNASLGEMYQQLEQQGVAVPYGFATTAQAFRDYLADNEILEPMRKQLAKLDARKQSLAKTGDNIRTLIREGEFSPSQRDQIVRSYQQLCDHAKIPDMPVAVRSSATAEDLPQASFAGQQESFLNIRGGDALLEACRECYASLYTDRAIAYREENHFPHEQVALSVGVQQMVEASAAGVMFTLDTESGFPDVVLINAAWGLGETVVKGSVNPDRYMAYKPFLDNPDLAPVIESTIGTKLYKMRYTGPDDHKKKSSRGAATITVDTTAEEQRRRVLSDAEVLQLSRWALAIERHYQRPMDIEWARDGDGQLFILQARPETIESQKDRDVMVSYKLNESGKILAEGASVGSAIASGPVCIVHEPGDVEHFPENAILVTERTDPDWVPIMRRAAGIVTNSGGTTSHAAIVSRELKKPAVVGCGNALDVLHKDMEITISGAEGATGRIYEGLLDFEKETISLADLPDTRTELMINAALPDGALQWWQLPVAGIGLTRIEFIISSQIRVHPMALINPEKVTDKDVAKKISELTAEFEQPTDYFVQTLARSVAKIAASQYPRPVIVRMSDFKSNEYRGLLGGKYFEHQEENPMLGFRGASRYYHPLYREGFQLECQAIRQAREAMGFDNIIVMIPFCRTPGEADKVLETMAEAGLIRGERGLQIYVMCEIPSNIILADEFARRFDGFSIGSNDLTQLILGIDRDSSLLKELFDARDEAVKRAIAEVIRVAHKYKRKVGICGQAPSDHPEFSEFLVGCGIDSISLNPDSVAKAWDYVAAAEKSPG